MPHALKYHRRTTTGGYTSFTSKEMQSWFSEDGQIFKNGSLNL